MKKFQDWHQCSCHNPQGTLGRIFNETDSDADHELCVESQRPPTLKSGEKFEPISLGELPEPSSGRRVRDLALGERARVSGTVWVKRIE